MNIRPTPNYSANDANDQITETQTMQIKYTPSQMNPFPEKPPLQSHKNEPGILTQVAFGLQRFCRSCTSHSLMSKLIQIHIH